LTQNNKFLYPNLHKVHLLHPEEEARSRRNFPKIKITYMAKKGALNIFEVFASLHNKQTKKGMYEVSSKTNAKVQKKLNSLR
jgi:hypothetical protein